MPARNCCEALSLKVVGEYGAMFFEPVISGSSPSQKRRLHCLATKFGTRFSRTWLTLDMRGAGWAIGH